MKKFLAIFLILGSYQVQADRVINDDLIVDGSACIGLDCVNGESFGFDTIRLKENNLRIKFDDTSTTASFPNNDWQLTANDSANGGANKFSVDDITGGRTPFTIEAGAPTHSLYVDDGGRIGIGTSTPVASLHTKTGNTPTLRLEQDGSSGFTPQTWDVASNETNFFIRDATNGSTLPFRVRPGAPTSSIDVAASGYVGFGTSSPAQKLHLRDDASGAEIALRLDDAEVQWDFMLKDSSNRLLVRSTSGGVTRTPIKVYENADTNLLTVGNDTDSGRIDITGSLYINNSVVTPDYVFEPDYQLESIAEHASQMWQNKHLPGVTPHTVNNDGKTVIQVGARSQEMLLELEKAHIYIKQLHDAIAKLEDEKLELRSTMQIANNNLEQRLARLEVAQ